MNFDLTKNLKDFGNASGCIALASWSVLFEGYSHRFRPPLDIAFAYIVFIICISSAVAAAIIVIKAGFRGNQAIANHVVAPSKTDAALPANQPPAPAVNPSAPKATRGTKKKP